MGLTTQFILGFPGIGIRDGGVPRLQDELAIHERKVTIVAGITPAGNPVKNESEKLQTSRLSHWHASQHRAVRNVQLLKASVVTKHPGN
eukprot:512083-Pyramimonas_sp.AAC.3